MGLLTFGTPLKWDELKPLADELRRRGVRQFAEQWPLLRNVKADRNYWGDELEYTLVKFNDRQQNVKALLKAKHLLDELHEKPSLSPSADWKPEYARFQIEGIPRLPYCGLNDCIENVEKIFHQRSAEINQLLDDDERALTIGCFPRMGCPDFTFPSHVPTPENSLSGSIMFTDEAIYLDHPTYPSFTQCTTEHRGGKPPILMPIFYDQNTERPFLDDLDGRTPTDYDREQMKPEHIYIDGAPVGASVCCLQVTMQCQSFDEAMLLHDQLLPLCPILLALSASTPIVRGLLMDADCRWNLFKQGADDRTAEERGEISLKRDRYVIPRSRCDTTDHYVTEKRQKFNDTPVPYCQQAFDAFIKAGVDPRFAVTLAHMFIRDPLQAFKEELTEDDHGKLNFFELFSLFHWETLRIKYPPLDGSSGWKIEFRPLEIQLTDFENAAFAIFLFLISRVILDGDAEFAMPVSKVVENMDSAQEYRAATDRKFWWRKSMTAGSADEFQEVTADEIINGNSAIGLVGLAELIDLWLDKDASLSPEQRKKVDTYVSLVKQRASGAIPTNAQWIRHFVTEHSTYKRDSRVSDQIAHDLLKEVSSLGKKGALKNQIL